MNTRTCGPIICTIASLLALVADAIAQPLDDPYYTDAQVQKNFYVAPWGSDAITWSMNSPSAPFATIDHARLQVRAFVVTLPHGPHRIRVNIAGGEYLITQPIVFDELDSGWADNKIVYQAWDPDGQLSLFNKDALITGGVKLTNWTLGTTPQGVSAWYCTVPSAIEDIRDLWVNNYRMVRARFPNVPAPCGNTQTNPVVPPCPNSGFLVAEFVEARGSETAPEQWIRVRTGDGTSFPTGVNWEQVEATAQHLWVSPIQRVTSAAPVSGSPNKVTLKFDVTEWDIPGTTLSMDLGALGIFNWSDWEQYPMTGEFDYNRAFLYVYGEQNSANPPPSGAIASQVILSNDLAFLNQDNEWYFDKTQNRLWLKVCSGTSPNNLTVVAPVATQLVVLDGAQDLDFFEISFAHTFQPLPLQAGSDIEGYTTVQGGRQWHDADYIATNRYNNVVAAAIEMRGAQRCHLRRSPVAHTGGSGVVVTTKIRTNVDPTEFIESNGCRVSSCEIFDIGAHGVFIGDELAVFDAVWAAQQTNGTDPSCDNLVLGNRIEGYGVTFRDSVGVFLGHGRDTQITDNEISYGNWSGMSLGTFQRQRVATPPTSECGTVPAWSQNTDGSQVFRNNIHHVMLRLIDGGGIYVQGSHVASSVAPSRLSSNYIHDLVLNPYWNFNHDNIVGFYFDGGSSGWYMVRNYTERVQTMFKFGYSYRLVGSSCDDLPTIRACTYNPQTMQYYAATPVFGRSAYPVAWSDSCVTSGTMYNFEGLLWSGASADVNKWYNPSTGSYRPYTASYGATGMPAASNSVLTSALPSNQEPILSAGPDDLTIFYPTTVRRIHRVPFCGNPADEPAWGMN
ncbi:MAG: right-handed parallel beta-helix repeat-containing protein [Phycisphaerales bacterium]